MEVLKKNKLSFTLLTVILMATLATPAYALIGGSPLVTFARDSGDPNKLDIIHISEIEITKGIVKSAETGRFSLRITGTFTTTSGGSITVLSSVVPIGKSKNLKDAGGSTVFIEGCIQLPFEEEEANKIKGVLDQNNDVDWNLRIDLVLTTGSGDEKTLDFTEVSGTLTPSST